MSILNRIRLGAATCAVVPLLLLATLLAQPAGDDPTRQSADELLAQVALPLEAHASAVRERLGGVEAQVQSLRAYAEEVLKSPEIYAGPQSRTASISDGATKRIEGAGPSPRP